jgi:diacylglycerol kinase (ATP)
MEEYAMRIGLLNNLRAGRNSKGVSRLLKLLSQHPEVAHVETSNARAVPEALWELARQDVELLVINGGDGTISHTLGEILGEGAFDGRIPDIAVLRGGRTNMTALDLGSRRDPVRAMAGLLQAARTGSLEDRTLERPVLRVQYGPGINTRYGMFVGAGVVHRGIEMVHRTIPRNRQGVSGGSLVMATLLARMALLGESDGVLTPDKIGILVDRSQIERGESKLVLASSLDRLFLRMQPFWGGGPGGVRLTSIASDAGGFARALPGILAGRPPAHVNERNGYISRNARHVALRMNCGFTVDGELIGPSPDRVLSISADDVVRFVRA